MNINKWLKYNIGPLNGKTAVVSGATGGLGKELCFLLAKHGAKITLAVRNEKLANDLKNEILQKHPKAEIDFINLDLANLKNVDACIEKLQTQKIDYFF